MRLTTILMSAFIVTVVAVAGIIANDNTGVMTAMTAQEMHGVVAGDCEPGPGPCEANRKVFATTCWRATNGQCGSASTETPCNALGACGEENCRKTGAPAVICALWPDHATSGCMLDPNIKDDCGDKWKDGACKWEDTGCFCHNGVKIGACKLERAKSCTP
jgi:hypothetical protein